MICKFSDKAFGRKQLGFGKIEKQKDERT